MKDSGSAPRKHREGARRVLKARYIEILIAKAAASDDEKLLDRIETRLREYEQEEETAAVRPVVHTRH